MPGRATKPHPINGDRPPKHRPPQGDPTREGYPQQWPQHRQRCHGLANGDASAGVATEAIAGIAVVPGNDQLPGNSLDLGRSSGKVLSPPAG